MTDRAKYLIESLELQSHPEGGYFKEVFRSGRAVFTEKNNKRRALTTIYFMLVEGQYSRFHKVNADEVWHYYEGDPLELIWLNDSFTQLDKALLGPVGKREQPVAAIPADCWQTARSTGSFVLAECSVGPGFEFSDFSMLKQDKTRVQLLNEMYPGLSAYL